ncbi:ribonuclease III [Uliginosibacterium sp. 31-16]|uniref:ribonuclease III n=1 Tax=Uliginosibacterium sp. 31-16 TaxID=3068315 RepID=UPI00273F8D68|nr:ribonuclease III [Uliginosibacterium sp. 31-16]MDP5240851.1 ribonuclease III [Uliginosibacterium sp. 31-16]
MKFEVLERQLSYRFQRTVLLRQALTHRSFSADHNERLEFLGDSILNMVVALALYVRFDGLREGEMSRLRAQLVRQDTLQMIAERLDLGSCLSLGEGELKSGGHRRPSILADALEAVFGAIYLDAGFEAVKRVIDGLYAEMLMSLDPARSLKDPKTALQEALQARRLPLPKYEMTEERGEAHAREFEVHCVIERLNICTAGVGASRRIAEQVAAAAALTQLEQA